MSDLVLNSIWILLSTFAFLFLPGYCCIIFLSAYKLSHLGRDWVEIKWITLPLSFSISLCLISVFALVADSLGFGLDWVIRVLIIVILSIFTGSFSYVIFDRSVHVFVLRFIKQSITTNKKIVQNLIAVVLQKEKKPTNNLKISFVYFSLTLLVIILAMYTGPYLSNGADTMYHVAATRSLLITNNPIPRQIFSIEPQPYPDPNSGTWHTALAIIAKVSQVDPIDVVWTVHVVVSGLLALTLAILTYEASQRPATSFLAVLLFFIVGGAVSIRSLINPNLMGQIIFWTILILIIHYAKRSNSVSPNRRSRSFDAITYLLLIGLLSFNLSAVHLQYSPVLVALLIGSLLMSIAAKMIRNIFPLTTSFITGTIVSDIWNHRENVAVSSALFSGHRYALFIKKIIAKIKDIFSSAYIQAIVVAIVSTLPLFIYRSLVVVDYNVTKSSTSSSVSSAQAVLNFNSLLYPLHYKYYFSYEILYLLAIILLIGLLVYWLRGDFGGIVVITSVLLAPVSSIMMGLLFGTGGLVLTTIGRMVRLTIPFLYIVWAWNFDLVFDGFKKITTGNKLALLTRITMALCVVMVSISPLVKGITNFINIYSPNSNYKGSVANGKQSQLVRRIPGAIYVMRSLPAGSVILTDSSTSFEMACFVSGLNFINMDRGKTPIQERVGFSEENAKKMRDFISGNLNHEDEIRLLLELNIDYVFVDQEAQYGEVFRDILTPIPIVSVVYESDKWRLYKVQYE